MERDMAKATLKSYRKMRDVYRAWPSDAPPAIELRFKVAPVTITLRKSRGPQG